MKKILLAILIAAGFQASAQTVQMNFQSGDRNLESANCWGFGAFSFVNNIPLTAGNNATLSWTGRSNQLTSLLPTASWVKSPWMKMGAGNITFQTRLDGSPGTTRSMEVMYTSYDPNAANTSKESAYTSFFTFSWPTATTTTLQNISIPVPAAIAGNPNNVYKIRISYLGTGGTGRAIIDNIVIPGEYWAEPSQGCMPKALIQDADSDGVADNADAYPNDAQRAYNNFFPTSGFGTYMFEDLWPSRGDYDFNDLVLSARYNHVTNAAGKVVETKAQVVLRATGGSFRNGFAMQFEGMPNNKVVSVSGNRITGNVHTIGSNGVESNVNNGATVVFFDNAYSVLQHPGQGIGINTSPGAPFVTPDTLNITIAYRDNGAAAPGGDVELADVASNKMNPFLIANQVRSAEVHLIDKAPTNLADATKFATLADKSNAAQGKYYRTENGLPWGLFIQGSVPYMKEKVDITTGYLKLIDWATSNGASFTNWFTNEAGNRDTNNLY